MKKKLKSINQSHIILLFLPNIDVLKRSKNEYKLFNQSMALSLQIKTRAYKCIV